MGGLLLATERRLEVAQTLPERAPNLGQTLRAEHEQRNHEHEQKMCWLKDVSDHGRTSLAAEGAQRLRDLKNHLKLTQRGYCRTITEILRLRLGTYG
jgi:hypothetical protein